MNPIQSLIEKRAAIEPHACVFSDGETQTSAIQLAQRLQSIGNAVQLSGASRVALLADNSPHWAVVDIACQLRGICLVPVPTFFSQAQFEHLLHSAAIELLIYDPALASRFTLPPAMAASSQPLPDSPLVMQSLTTETEAQLPADTTKITFTSGSTGTPKGVCLSFEQCLTVARSLGDAIAVEQPRHLCVLPLSTLLENIGGLYLPLLLGGSSLILPPHALGMQGSSGLQAANFLQAVESQQPHTMILVPQLLLVLDRALARGWRAPDSLRFIAVGGARVSVAMTKRLRDYGLPVYEGYGLSECASVVSLNSPGADRAGSSGKILPHVNVTSIGGELMVDGNSFLGYLNQPESWGSQQIATGDMGGVDEDGFVTVAGRCKNLIITSFGRNISPEWVESELLACGLFAQVVVVGDGRPHCAALIHPLYPGMHDSQIQAAIDEANCRLPDYARTGCWLRLQAPLSAAEGLLTDNGRPRRDRVLQKFAVPLQTLYDTTEELLTS